MRSYTHRVGAARSLPSRLGTPASPLCVLPVPAATFEQQQPAWRPAPHAAACVARRRGRLNTAHLLADSYLFARITNLRSNLDINSLSGSLPPTLLSANPRLFFVQVSPAAWLTERLFICVWCVVCGGGGVVVVVVVCGGGGGGGVVGVGGGGGGGGGIGRLQEAGST